MFCQLALEEGVLSEFECCPECKSEKILHDCDNGEVVCMGCGLVLGESEFAPPADRLPKFNSSSPLAYTSFALGSEVCSSQRTELNVAQDIDRVIQKLELPRSLQHIAINYVRKLRRLKCQRKVRIRLSRVELTVVAVWNAIKILKYPLSADEYLKKLQCVFNVEKLMRIEKRAGNFIRIENRVSDVSLVIGYVNKISAKLEQVVGSVYASKVSSYAIEIVLANPGVVTNRKANLVAASALLAADELLAKRLQLKVVAKAANAGMGSVSMLLASCKKYAPPLPKECAALKFSSYFGRDGFFGVKA